MDGSTDRNKGDRYKRIVKEKERYISPSKQERQNNRTDLNKIFNRNILNLMQASIPEIK